MNVSYVHPQPRWRVTGVEGGTVEFNDNQMVSLVNSFLFQHGLGEVEERWVSNGKAYRLKPMPDEALPE
jgi:hypothetical protein